MTSLLCFNTSCFSMKLRQNGTKSNHWLVYLFAQMKTFLKKTFSSGDLKLHFSVQTNSGKNFSQKTKNLFLNFLLLLLFEIGQFQFFLRKKTFSRWNEIFAWICIEWHFCCFLSIFWLIDNFCRKQRCSQRGALISLILVLGSHRSNLKKKPLESQKWLNVSPLIVRCSQLLVLVKSHEHKIFRQNFAF